MQIIFDSEEEKKEFVEWTCPRLRDPRICDRKGTCESCWEKEYPGAMEVKNGNYNGSK